MSYSSMQCLDCPATLTVELKDRAERQELIAALERAELWYAMHYGGALLPAVPQELLDTLRGSM